MEILFIWLLFAIAVAILASRKGRSGFGWFLFSVIFSPLIGFLFVLVLGDASPDAIKPNPNTHVKCPDCREFVLKEARVCKHCGCKLVPQ